MRIDVYGTFLNEAAHVVAAAWEVVGGKKLGPDQLYDLNDLLDEFFTDLAAEGGEGDGG